MISIAIGICGHLALIHSHPPLAPINQQARVASVREEVESRTDMTAVFNISDRERLPVVVIQDRLTDDELLEHLSKTVQASIRTSASTLQFAQDTSAIAALESNWRTSAESALADYLAELEAEAQQGRSFDNIIDNVRPLLNEYLRIYPGSDEQRLQLQQRIRAQSLEVHLIGKVVQDQQASIRNFTNRYRLLPGVTERHYVLLTSSDSGAASELFSQYNAGRSALRAMIQDSQFSDYPGEYMAIGLPESLAPAERIALSVRPDFNSIGIMLHVFGTDGALIGTSFKVLPIKPSEAFSPGWTRNLRQIEAPIAQELIALDTAAVSAPMFSPSAYQPTAEPSQEFINFLESGKSLYDSTLAPLTAEIGRVREKDVIALWPDAAHLVALRHVSDGVLDGEAALISMIAQRIVKVTELDNVILIEPFDPLWNAHHTIPVDVHRRIVELGLSERRITIFDLADILSKSSTNRFYGSHYFNHLMRTLVSVGVRVPPTNTFTPVSLSLLGSLVSAPPEENELNTSRPMPTLSAREVDLAMQWGRTWMFFFEEPGEMSTGGTSFNLFSPYLLANGIPANAQIVIRQEVVQRWNVPGASPSTAGIDLESLAFAVVDGRQQDETTTFENALRRIGPVSFPKWRRMELLLMLPNNSFQISQAYIEQTGPAPLLEFDNWPPEILEELRRLVRVYEDRADRD